VSLISCILLYNNLYSYQRIAKCHHLQQHIPMSTLLKSSAALKPKRPLTAYHLFLQLEREYVIQTSEGEVADKSIFKLDQKVYLENVPPYPGKNILQLQYIAIFAINMYCIDCKYCNIYCNSIKILQLILV